jgi:hypothetical protein
MRYDCQGRGLWPGTIVHYLRGEQVGRTESPRGFTLPYRDDVWSVVVPGSVEEMLHEWVCSIPEENFTRG